MKLGLIGLGNFGINYIKNINNIENLDLSFVCSKDKKKIDGLNENIEYFTNWMDSLEFAESKRVDGLIVAINPEMHFKIGMESLKKKIPVLLEKPATTHLYEAVELSEASIEYQTPFYINYINLKSQPFKYLLKLIKIEDILNIESCNYNNGPFRNFSSFWDWGIHEISLGCSLFKSYPHIDYVEVRKNNYSKGEKYHIILDYNGKKHSMWFGNGFDRRNSSIEINTIQENSYTIKNNNLFLNNKQLTSFEQNTALKESIQHFQNIIKNNSNIEEPFLTIECTKIMSEIEEMINSNKCVFC